MNPRKVFARARRENKALRVVQQIADSEGRSAHAVLVRLTQGATGAPGAIAQRRAHQEAVLASSGRLQKLKDREALPAKVSAQAFRLQMILDASPLTPDHIDDAARTLLED